MIKRLTITFLLGVCAPVVLALYAGGEQITQVGVRLTAIEQGIGLAQRHWLVDAVPEHDPALRVAQSEPLPAAVRTKGKRR